MKKIYIVFIFILFLIIYLYVVSYPNYDMLMLKKNSVINILLYIINPVTFIRYNINFYKKFKLADTKDAIVTKKKDLLIGFLGDTTFSKIENFNIDVQKLSIPHINVLNFESIIKNKCNHFDKLIYTPLNRAIYIIDKLLKNGLKKDLKFDMIKTCSENSINVFRKKTKNLINYYSILNNHADDYGIKTFNNFKNILTKNNITYFDNHGKIINIKNKKILFISFTLILKTFNKKFPGYVTEKELINIINNINVNKNTYVVLSIHWPGEFNNNYNSNFYNNIINKLIGKVHLIYGHHGHIDGGCKTFKKNNKELLVIFSNGNFFFEEMQYFARKINQDSVSKMPYYIISFTKNKHNNICCRLYNKFILENKIINKE